MKKKKLIVISILVALFLFITGIVVADKTAVFDNKIYSLVRLLDSNFFDNYFIFITKFGNPIVVVTIVLILILLFRNNDGLLLGFVAANSALTNQLLKYIIKRERPLVVKLIEQGGYSYPSGHAMISLSIYGFLLYLVFKKINNKFIKYSIGGLLLILILSVGVSRIYLGVHYASDIIGGYLLALIELILIIEFFNKRFRGN